MDQPIDRRAAFKAALAVGLAGTGGAASAASEPSPTPVAAPSRGRLTLDMVQPNPGQPPPQTAYLDPAFLRARSYGAVVIEHAIEGTATFDAYDPGLIPKDSDEARLAGRLRSEIAARIAAAKSQGLAAYAWVQYLVLPKRLLARHGAAMVDAAGRIDLARPATQAVVAAFTRELLFTFPNLDGLVVRTGEIYLQDLPYHAARVAAPGAGAEDAIQSATAIIHGEQSHLALLSVLRQEVCVAAGRRLIYRTWDFGDNFHNNVRYYLGVTDRIEPHPRLSFSIKHQRGDFHRLTAFNPTLGRGRHPQIVEAQCQLEAYGKGAHPYYVGRGVIEGWEEMAWLQPAGAAQGLRDLAASPQWAGLWTWSRGGGWDGPEIQDELWCDLNAFVLSGFARDPARSEASLFEQYGREVLGLSGGDTGLLRELCLASAAAVLRGQLSDLGAQIDLWWARDDTLSEPRLTDFVDKGLTEAAIAEKQTAVAMWSDIAQRMGQVRFSTPRRQTFAEVSARYGQFKYSIIAAAWTALLLAEAGGRDGGVFETARIAAAVADYDRLWVQWRALAASQPQCSTLPRPIARGGGPGLGAAMDRLRARFGSGRPMLGA